MPLLRLDALNEILYIPAFFSLLSNVAILLPKTSYTSIETNFVDGISNLIFVVGLNGLG